MHTLFRFILVIPVIAVVAGCSGSQVNTVEIDQPVGVSTNQVIEDVDTIEPEQEQKEEATPPPKGDDVEKSEQQEETEQIIEQEESEQSADNGNAEESPPPVEITPEPEPEAQVEQVSVETQPDADPEPEIQPEEPKEVETKTQTSSKQKNQKKKEQKSTSQQKNKESESEQQKDIAVTLTVAGPGAGNYSVTVPHGASVQQVMNAAGAQGFSYSTKAYSGLGVYVEAVNGVKEDGGMYWIYSVNGAKATTGISNYKLNNGDTVLWTYEKQY